MLSLLLPLAVSAQVAQLAELEPPNRREYERFGCAVACQGNLIIVGAFNDRDLGRSGRGAAYVYELDGSGSPISALKLTPSDANDGDEFGISLALDADYLAIGNAADDDRGADSGSVYVFQRLSDGSWSELGEIHAPSPQSGANFGQSVALRGTQLLIGAPYEDSAQQDAGAAYLYELSPSLGVSLVARLASPRAEINGFFGHSVALDEGLLAVGAYNESVDGTPEAGAVYPFEQIAAGAWTSSVRLKLGRSSVGNRFGYSIALDGERLLVGVPEYDAVGYDTGACCLYERLGPSSWRLCDFFFHQHYVSNQEFLGTSVALSGDRAVLGAPGVESYRFGHAVLAEIGAAGVLKEVADLTAGYPHFDEHGHAVAIDGDLIVVGVPGDDSWGYASGLCFAFTASPLRGDVASVSINAEGVQTLALTAGKEHAFRRYVVLGSFTGVTSGIPLPGGFEMPLRRDQYFQHTSGSVNAPPLEDSLGWLDENGSATARFKLALGTDPRLAGRTLKHAAAVFDPSTGQVVFVSNAVEILITP